MAHDTDPPEVREVEDVEPEDLFDVVCRLDDLAEWLKPNYPDEAAAVQAVSDRLKGYIELRVAEA